jgi:hypothetical protein
MYGVYILLTISCYSYFYEFYIHACDSDVFRFHVVSFNFMTFIILELHIQAIVSLFLVHLVRSCLCIMISAIPTSANVHDFANGRGGGDLSAGKRQTTWKMTMPVWTWSGFVSLTSLILITERCTEPWIWREPWHTGRRLQYVCYSQT